MRADRCIVFLNQMPISSFSIQKIVRIAFFEFPALSYLLIVVPSSLLPSSMQLQWERGGTTKPSSMEETMVDAAWAWLGWPFVWVNEWMASSRSIKTPCLNLYTAASFSDPGPNPDGGLSHPEMMFDQIIMAESSLPFFLFLPQHFDRWSEIIFLI